MTIYASYDILYIDGEKTGTLIYTPLLHILSPESEKDLKELGYNINELKMNVIEFENNRFTK